MKRSPALPVEAALLQQVAGIRVADLAREAGLSWLYTRQMLSGERRPTSKFFAAWARLHIPKRAEERALTVLIVLRDLK